MALTNEEYASAYKKYHEKRRDNSFERSDMSKLHGLVVGSKAKTILDYGSGKGLQYSKDKLHQRFGIEYKNITCYDIGVDEFSQLPEGQFDGVICMDVLEHIPEEFLEDNLKTIFSKATKFVYCVIHCGLARKVLSNGENAHCTIKPPAWWKQTITSYNTNDVPLMISYRIPTDPELNVLGLK